MAEDQWKRSEQTAVVVGGRRSDGVENRFWHPFARTPSGDLVPECDQLRGVGCDELAIEEKEPNLLERCRPAQLD